tara:strand:+ start:244 stop:2376 length:2133 start_codon:yes stop_codon:yes gene_type:complete
MIKKQMKIAYKELLDNKSEAIAKLVDELNDKKGTGIKSIPKSNLENAMFKNPDGSGGSTIISKPAFSYDIPEVKDFKAEFVYNFFTKDERVRTVKNKNDQILDLDSTNTADIEYQIKNDQLPRFVKFTFKPANNSHFMNGALPGESNRYNNQEVADIQTVKENIDRLLVEGASSSNVFTGFEIIDTGLENNLYKGLLSSLELLEIKTELDSPKSAVDKLADALREDGGLTGESKKLLLEAMSVNRSEGVTFAKSDMPKDMALAGLDPVSRQSFSLKCNNLFFNDIIARASRIPLGVFQDEIRALNNISKKFQYETLDTLDKDPTKINEQEYANKVEAIEIFNINPNENNGINSKYRIRILGYVIQKYEILKNEATEKLENIFVGNINSLYAIDNNVRYGGNYVYKIRTVCEVVAPVINYNQDNPLLDELVYAKFLIASEGVTASLHCEERIAPPPPAGVRARFDFKNKMPIVTWQFPLNKQRDIKRFQIFKRENVKLPFTLCAEYDFDDSIIRTSVNEIAQSKNVYRLRRPKIDYIDNKFKPGSTPIYAIASVDAHGYSSNLSTQIQVKYNSAQNKFSFKLVSREQAPKPYPNLYLEQDTFKDVMKVSGYERMTVFFDPEYYKVLQNNKGDVERKRNSTNPGKVAVREEDARFIAANPNEPTYFIQMLNIDNQKSEKIEIQIGDKTRNQSIRAPVANFSEKNLSFEFGVD